LFLYAGALASLSSIALAQNANQRARAKVKSLPPIVAPVVPAAVAPASVVATTPAATTPAATTPAAVVAATPAATAIAAPAETAPVVTDVAARAALKAGLESNTAGNLRAADAAFRQAIVLAPAGEAGDVISMEAAKRLGFLAFENRDPRTAETFFGAEAVLARRLYFSAKISPRGFADAVSRFASATGAMGRSGDSAALVFYAQEIKSRAQAEASAQLLNRDANNAADAVSGVRVAASGLCVVGRDPVLRDRVSCDDEAGARGEALSMQARQIRASAPPPPTKEEKEAKAAKAKAKGGG
jgi:ribonuclease E